VKGPAWVVARQDIAVRNSGTYSAALYLMAIAEHGGSVADARDEQT